MHALEPAAPRVDLVIDGIVYGFQPYGGINTYFNEVASHLSRRNDVSVEFWVPRGCKGRPSEAPGIRRLARELLPTRTGVSWKADQLLCPVLEKLNAAYRSARLWHRPRCVFHSTYFTIPPQRVAHVATAYDLNHELLAHRYGDAWGQWLRRTYRDYLADATAIIAISHKTKSDLVRMYHDMSPAKIHVVHLAVNRSRFWPDPDCGALHTAGVKAKAYVLYVGGRSDKYKNFSGLLTAFATSGLSTHLSLVVAGAGWTTAETAALHELQLHNSVTLVENPSDELLRKLYSCAAGLVYPSLHEGFGLPLLEAMACGTPVLASDIAVFREVCSNAAVFFDPHEPLDIGRALRCVLDGATRQHLIEAGTRRLSSFSWESCAEQTRQVYLDALQTGAPERVAPGIAAATAATDGGVAS